MAEKTRVLLLEPDHKTAAELARHLWQAPLVVDTAATVAGALMRVRDFDPDVVIAPDDERVDGADFCAQLKRISRNRLVLLVYGPERTQAATHAEEAGADGWLYAPYNAGAVVSCVQWAVRVREAHRELERLRVLVDEAALAPAPGLGEAGRIEVEFFKRTMLMEVRRSKRYRYPLALLCVGVDRFESTLGRLPVHVRTREMGKMLASILDTIRDLDLAVLEGEGRCLVCLPQTDLDGARYVAQRVVELAPKACSELPVTVSVGLAAFDGSDDEVSFKGLFDHAALCLRRAQAQGGGQVELRT